jgi:hypothetical protein
MSTTTEKTVAEHTRQMAEGLAAVACTCKAEMDRLTSASDATVAQAFADMGGPDIIKALEDFATAAGVAAVMAERFKDLLVERRRKAGGKAEGGEN